MATTVGATRCSRSVADRTNGADRRTSTGPITAQATSTRAGATTTPAAAKTAGAPRRTPTTTTTAWSTSQAAASERSRRVATNGEVRPFIDRCNGPTTATPTGARAARGHRADRTTPARATAARATLPASLAHQRRANRLTDPLR